MADYYNPTVIDPPIPMADMTACERLLLCGMFEHDVDDTAETIRFYASTGVNDMPSFEMATVLTALATDAGTDTLASRLFVEHIFDVGTGADELTLDLSITSHEGVLQDIVRRAPHLQSIAVITSFICSKMLPDGFGGMAVLVTAHAIQSQTTDEVLQEFRVAAGLEAPSDAPRQ